MSARQAVLAVSATTAAWHPRIVVAGNGARREFPSLVERFWSQVAAGEGECWDWTGRTTSDGYGLFSVNPLHVAAYRWSYTLLRDEIPAGLELDHLCRRPVCVNPWHLEPVTKAENLRRAFLRSSCREGHSMADAIERVRSGRVARECRTCARTRKRNHMRKVRSGQVVPQ